MSNPCCHGFKCPYRGYGEDGDYLCTHPTPARDADEDDRYRLAYETDCPLRERDQYCNEPTVFDILDLYMYDDEVSDSIERGYRLMQEESRKMFERIRAQVEARERGKEMNRDVRHRGFRDIPGYRDRERSRCHFRTPHELDLPLARQDGSVGRRCGRGPDMRGHVRHSIHEG